MMEIDRISYIFGSFTRRRQSQEVGAAKRRSIEPVAAATKIIHDRSRSAPHTTSKKPPSTFTATSPRARSVYNVTFDDNKFRCPMCRRPYVEPRVLPCLHTFCVGCLQELEAAAACRGDPLNDDDSTNTSKSCKASGTEESAVHHHHNTRSSGKLQHSRSRGSCTSSSYDIHKLVNCPTCGSRTEVPTGGVASFPPNYLVQHRMVLATLNAQNTHLLCDLCTADVSAQSRCMECALSFCVHCEEVHLRQKSSADHEVLPLDEARKRGITKVRRQIMCLEHPNQELSIFCSSCCQVICRDCISGGSIHKGHVCEPVARAVKSHLTNLRLAAERAKAAAEQSALAANRLNVTSKKIELQCNQMQSDVDKFIDNYIRSIEQHRSNLCKQIDDTRQEKLRLLGQCKHGLRKKVKDARDLAFFLDELLNEGTDVEVMSFVKPVMKKIERCNHSLMDIRGQELCLAESLQFLPEEAVQNSGSLCPLYGVITSQMVSPSHCVLSSEGLHNLRVGKKTEIILETRDQNNTKLERGGDQITAEIKYRDAGVSRCLVADVDDRRDGSYCITFVPDVSGKLVLTVTVKGQPIKDSPFPIVVRTLKPHHGTFHCCTFCSSGGSKEASCGCEGKMPGGYRGCGHGHEGHPGKRHWSCCGNTLEHSECTRTNSHYQFTL